MGAVTERSSRPESAAIELGPSEDVPRRALLRGGIAAALGVVALDRALASTAPSGGTPGDTPGGAPEAVAAPTISGARGTVTLQATDVTVRVIGAGRGTAPRRGDALLLDGTLFLDGEEVGELHGTGVHLVRSGRNAQGRAAGTWQHVFQLDDGTIVGAGAATHDAEPDELAIVGGTGSYARAAGTYAARVSPRGLGGDATASFVLDITIPEV